MHQHVRNCTASVGPVTNTNAVAAVAETGPIAVEGYYPLYNTIAGANAASGTGTNHSHVQCSDILYAYRWLLE